MRDEEAAWIVRKIHSSSLKCDTPVASAALEALIIALAYTRKFFLKSNCLPDSTIIEKFILYINWFNGNAELFMILQF